MAGKRGVQLPDEPRDTDFEDYVAAHLQSSGLYVERSIVERAETEVLELDIIATSYSSDESPNERLIEVKSGGWGFTEIFKLSGWGKYLKLDDLTLVVCKEKPTQEFYDRKSSDIGVDLCILKNNHHDCDERRLLRGFQSDPVDVLYLRYSFLLERRLLKDLNKKKKSHPDRDSYKALEHYYNTLHSAIFFSKNILKKAEKLYDLFKENPSITKRVANECEGANFSGEHERIPDSIFKQTFFEAEYTDLTYSCFIEHRARLSILKAAVDFCLYEEHGIDERINADIELMGFTFSLKSFLPESFLKSLDEIRNDAYFHRYPAFWQNFLWLFGGMILEDYREEDYKLLSLKTGIPVSQIDRALNIYEILFPVSGGWFVEPTERSNIKHMKMLALPFLGIGANYRKKMYTAENSFDAMKISGSYTKSNLVRWNNLAAEVLRG